MPPSTIRFAAFEVDLKKSELRKHGHRIKLQDQPCKILLALLENPGEVVSREELQARIWGPDTFVEFNHGLNAAVTRLRNALGDSAEDPRYIETVARRGYRFIAPIEAASAPAEPEPPTIPPTPKAKRLWVVGAVVLVLGLIGASIWWQRRTVPTAPPRLNPITALIGSETMPTFSPDGQQLAYVWNGENEQNSDIYVKMVGSENALRLTSHPGADLLPSWSPDGRQIAFFRVHGATGLYLVSPLGGPERRVMEFPGLDKRQSGPETTIVGDLLYPIVHLPSWSRDGKFLAIVKRSEPPVADDGTVLLVPSEGGEPRPLLVPKPQAWYRHPTFSPDGRRLAAVLCQSINEGKEDCQLQVFSLGLDLSLRGEPLTVLPDSKGLRGLAWTQDGHSLIVSAFGLPHFHLWRVNADQPATPERLEIAGADAHWPAISANDRLAFSRSNIQADLWRLDLGAKPYPFLSSTARDVSPVFSPDGRRIAFQSARGGTIEIWIARADGTELVQLTKNGNRQSGSPQWSPDSRRIVFDSSGSENKSNVWIVDPEGGSPRQVTDGFGNCVIANWSRDGKWIYFSSDRSGRPEIWRKSADGAGAAEQITRHGGRAGFESADGKTIYYTKTPQGTEGIFAQALAGGEEKHLLSDPIIRWSFFVDATGIYYISGKDPKAAEIRVFEFATQRSRTISAIERPIAFGLSATPDHKSFLYSRPVTGADLMLIENFR